jgi:hypothetical protein
MAIENPADKLLQGNGKPKKAWLWLEGLRCFRRNFRAWVKWALVVWLLGLVVCIPALKSALSIYLAEILGVIGEIVPLAAFGAFFIKHEPIFSATKFRRQDVLTILNGVLCTFLRAVPIWCGAIVAMSLQQILDYFGVSLPFDSDARKMFFGILGIIGFLVLMGNFCYFMFRVFQFFALVANNVARPFETGKLLNHGHWWRVFGNFCILYSLKIFFEIVVMYFSSAIFGYINGDNGGLLGLMEIAPLGYFWLAILALYSTISMGACMALFSAINRVQYQERLRDDPAFQLVLNGDVELRA